MFGRPGKRRIWFRDPLVVQAMSCTFILSAAAHRSSGTSGKGREIILSVRTAAIGMSAAGDTSQFRDAQESRFVGGSGDVQFRDREAEERARCVAVLVLVRVLPDVLAVREGGRRGAWPGVSQGVEYV